MHNVATLAASAIHLAHAAPAVEPLQVNPVIRKLFMLMHGSYGNLFIGKFSTGEKDGQGRDKGIRAAMKVWESKLAHFPGDVVESAAGRMGEAHAKFPPNLPEFEGLCLAVMPRQTYAEAEGLPRLPAPVVAPPEPVSFELRKDGKDWARRLMARHERGDVLRMAQLQYARQALGLVA